MNTIINVTQRDIKHGLKKTSDSCPIYLAIKRQTILPDCRIHEDFAEEMALKKKWGLPKIAVKFIADFDFGLPVKPFSFNLPGIRPYLKARGEKA